MRRPKLWFSVNLLSTLGKLTSQISVLVLDDMSNQTLANHMKMLCRKGQWSMYKGKFIQHGHGM